MTSAHRSIPALHGLAALVADTAAACSTAPDLPKRTEDFAEVLDVEDLVRSHGVYLPAGYDGAEPYALEGAGHFGPESAVPVGDAPATFLLRHPR